MKRATRSIITWLAVAAMATLVLACEQATPAPAATPPAPAPEEPSPEKPTLYGTWERVFEWFDGDGDAISTTERLVFSESGKAFWHVDQFNLFGDDRHSPNGHIADWKATDDTITKTFIGWDDQTDDWDTMPTMIDKSYSLSDSGDVLFVHNWGDEERVDSFERYTRVPDPLPSNPTFFGTWQYVSGYWDDSGLAGTTTRTLTFTENRWILYEVQTVDDEIVDDWTPSGRWSATASSVTKTTAHADRDDDGNWDVEERSFAKEFSWGAGGELFVIDWTHDPETGEVQGPEIERYMPLTDLLPPLAGTWVHDFEEERDGERMTIGDAFTYTYQGEEDGTVYTWSFSGSWRHEKAKAFLHVDSQSVTYSETYDAEAAEWFDSRFDGHEVRIAYAPSGIADTMVVSLFWGEVQYDENTDTWTNNEGSPYGRYDRRFVRQGP